MSIHFKKDGNWKKLSTPYIKQDGQWVEVLEVYFKEDGAWKLVYPSTTGPTIEPTIFWSIENSKLNSTDITDAIKPTNLMAHFGPNSQEVTLKWDVFSSSSVDHYNIYRSPTLSASFTKINGQSTTTENYIDSGLISGTYYYEVTAVTNDGTETAPSNMVSVFVPQAINMATLSATSIKDESAKLNGEVSNVGQNSSIFLSFEWGEQGSGLPNNIDAFQTDTDITFSVGLFEEQQQLSQSISAGQAGDLVRPVDWDPSTGRLAAGSNDDNLYIYDTNINLTNTISENAGDIRGVDWDKNSGRLAASSQSGSVFIYDSNLNKINTLNDSLDVATGIEWDEGTGRLAVGSWDNAVYVYDSNLNLIKSLLPQADHNIFDVGWDHNNGRLAFGGENDNLDLYDSNLSFIETKNYSGSVNSVDWDINSRRLAVGTGEQNTYIYDSNLSEITTLEDPTANVRGVSWDPLTGRLAVASNDQNAYVYSSELQLIQIITDPNDEAIKVDWDEISSRLALSSSDTNTYIYNTNGLLSSNTTYEFRAVGTYQIGSSVTEKGSINTFTTT